MIASWHVGWDIELESLLRLVLATVAKRTVPLEAGRHFPCRAVVDREADLTAPSPVVTDAIETEVLSRSRGPRRDWCALRSSDEVEVAPAGERSGAAAAVVRVLQVGISWTGEMRVVGCVEGGWIVELHVCLHKCNEKEKEHGEHGGERMHGVGDCAGDRAGNEGSNFGGKRVEGA